MSSTPASLCRASFNQGIWCVLETVSAKKYAYIRAGDSIGSSRSCKLLISSRGMRPVLGVFLEDSQGLSFKNFASQSIHRIEANQTIEWEDFRFHFFEERDFLSNHLNEFWCEFRSILKNDVSGNETQALREFSARNLINLDFPESLKSRLIQHYSELQLQGPVEDLLQDPMVTDILVEAHDRIFIERGGPGLQKSNFSFSNEKAYQLYLENLLSRSDKKIDESHPCVDFMIKADVRAHVIGPPITGGQTYLSIRKARRKPWSLKCLQENSLFGRKEAELIRLFIEQRKTILISGATGSGKTSLLNAILAEMPEEERLVVIEDTPEIRLSRSNVAFLRTRMSESTDLKWISMSDLVRNSLRMRPDRIILGELRGPEAQDFLNAINTGHPGSLSSIHANSCLDALWRLKCLIRSSNHRMPDDSTTELIARNVQLVIHCAKSSGGRRRIVEISRIQGRERSGFRLERLV